jgi:hypothetical protein
MSTCLIDLASQHSDTSVAGQTQSLHTTPRQTPMPSVTSTSMEIVSIEEEAESPSRVQSQRTEDLDMVNNETAESMMSLMSDTRGQECNLNTPLTELCYSDHLRAVGSVAARVKPRASIPRHTHLQRVKSATYKTALERTLPRNSCTTEHNPQYYTYPARLVRLCASPEGRRVDCTGSAARALDEQGRVHCVGPAILLPTCRSKTKPMMLPFYQTTISIRTCLPTLHSLYRTMHRPTRRERYGRPQISSLDLLQRPIFANRFG